MIIRGENHGPTSDNPGHLAGVVFWRYSTGFLTHFPCFHFLPTLKNKAMLTTDLIADLDALLEPSRYKDYGPNGLQVEGGTTITRVITAATASLAAISFAAAQKADAILVHHGILWGSRDLRLTGMIAQRVRTLMQANISLIAYHLPLDAQPQVGNNAVALRMLGIDQHQAFGEQNLGRCGDLPNPCTAAELAARCQTAFTHPVLHCPGGPARISRVGVVTGGGQAWLTAAAAAGCDAFITGETSEQTWHEAAELGIHCFACGHHATEDHAIHELGARMAKKHGISHVSFLPSVPV